MSSPRRNHRGASLVELLLVLAIAGILIGLGTPPLLEASRRQRLNLAAAEVRSSFALARALAIRHGVNAAVKFQVLDGKLAFTLFRDGDGDGVLNADIRSGVDPPHGPPHFLVIAGSDIRFGFPPGRAPRDPGDPSRRLDRLDDPIRFNASDLASFDSWGGATPGTAYMTNGHELVALRIPGRSARVRKITYDPVFERWQ
jgi:prepilin-type N-terminal cleavage/methylation domain-containing protein